MIVDDIKADNIHAIKERNTNARAIYGVVMNKILLQSIELKKAGKPQTDADVVPLIQKTIKELTEESENYLKAGNKEQADIVLAQREIISKYLPQMMTEQEIKKIISTLPDQSVPSVMKHFKANYAGKVDMSLVSKIARG